MHVLIIGAGAIGAFYGAALARQGATVSVVCRSDYEVVRADGFRLRSASLGDQVFKPAQVLRSAEECSFTPDVAVLASKVLEGVDRAALLRPAVGPNTAIVLIQNGVDIEQEIVDAFPSAELLSCLAFVAVSREGDGVIHHQSGGSLVVGRYPSGRSDRAEQLAAMFEAGGVRCKATEDVVAARWQKAVWNASFNPISIMGGVLDTGQMLADEDSVAFIRRVMQEICDVAAAAGSPQRPNLIDSLLAGTRSMPPYKTSMALDYEHRRPMEIEAILGAVVRRGRALNVSLPSLESIYAIAKMIQRARTP